MLHVSKKDKGGWTVWIATGGHLHLGNLPERLRAILDKPDFSDSVVRRLFPQAYRDDPEAEAEYQRLLRDDHIRQKVAAVEAFERTLASGQEIEIDGNTILAVDLIDEDLTHWLGFLHDMRILIGTRLDITEDNWHEKFSPDDPNADEWILLEWLSYIEEHIVDAVRDAEGLAS